MPQLMPLGYTTQPDPQQLALQQATQGIQRGQLPNWMFHEPTLNAGPGVAEALSQAGTAMEDPRNAWMGLGPLAGMIGKAGRFGRVPHFGQDAGGFNTATRDMRRNLGIHMPNRRIDEIPGGTEKAVRSQYLNDMLGYNTMADVMHQGPMGENAPRYLMAQDMFTALPPVEQGLMQDVLKGRGRLQSEMLRQSLPTGGGGGVPDAAMLRRFGFGSPTQ